VSRRPYPVDVEYADIQGGILTAYGRLGFPFGRFALVCVHDAAGGREFVEKLRNRVTTAVRWPSRKENIAPGRLVIERPPVTWNLAFTFRGLAALGVPTRTLRGMPDEFMDSMAGRCKIIGDATEENPLAGWDRVWDPAGRGRDVHILILLNAQMGEDGRPLPELDQAQADVAKFCAESEGRVELLAGHRGADEHWQQLEALRDSNGLPCAKEHFGFTDAISDPVFEGQYPKLQENERAVGSGASDGAGNWRPLAAGEFLLGWPDEAQEIPGAAMPLDFSRNGTFIAYRKLHQDVAGFKAWIDKTAAGLQQAWKLPHFEAARDTLLAKMAGRWLDGVPLEVAPDWYSWQTFNDECKPKDGHVVRDDSARARALVDFGYRDDRDGLKCPLGAHIRRSNTRDTLDPLGDKPKGSSRMGSALNNRRRILRRGLPYGHADNEDGEHGIVMLVVCASLQRQFEFVQQQWLNYGLDADSGNDGCPLVGNHPKDAKFVIPAHPAAAVPPFIATGLEQWVQTRGGDYFFVPSMTALRMIGMGTVDPT